MMGNYLKPLLALDLYCGAGGASMGLHEAGFKVIGIDIRPQPNYPFEFVQGNALRPPFNLNNFDFFWASPPCQKYTRMSQGLLQSQGRGREYPDLIAETRLLLQSIGKPYVIENVPGASLINPVMLCGSSFGLLVQRHRLFETNWPLITPQCQHYLWPKDKPPLHRLQGKSRCVGCYGHGRAKGDNVALWQKAMGITWMTRKELSQAIPVAYSRFIGKFYRNLNNSL
jgi:DNA (cytosine-5)-methyltransferase 1